MHIGILGTGLMGAPMAIKLSESGFAITAYNRSPEKLAPLQKVGIKTATSAAEVIQESDCTILMLADAQAIEKVVFAEETKQKLTDKTLIQMGTIAPQESKAIRDRVVEVGGEYLEAPVLGSIPQVKAGELQVMVGATPEQFERWVKVLRSFGPEPQLMGEVGTGAAVKLAMNQLIGSLTNAFALSLSLVQQEGLNVEDFMEIVRGSALYAPTFDKKLPRMLEGNFADPNFPSKHLLKDMKLFIQEAEAKGLDTSLVAAVQQGVEKAIALGLADADYSALFRAVNSPKESG